MNARGPGELGHETLIQLVVVEGQEKVMVLLAFSETSGASYS